VTPIQHRESGGAMAARNTAAKNPDTIERESTWQGLIFRYARDKRIGGYLIRVAGPFSERMVGMEVPVTLKDGTEHQEKLLSLIWGGVDKETGDKVALYRFESRPREVETVEF
jgi:hypothetical protein